MKKIKIYNRDFKDISLDETIKYVNNRQFLQVLSPLVENYNSLIKYTKSLEDRIDKLESKNDLY